MSPETARDLLQAAASNNSYRAALASESCAFMKREHLIPDDLAARCEKLKQNGDIFEANAKDLVAECGIEQKFANLQHCITNGFRDAVRGNALEATCLAFAQTVREHFAAVTELEDCLKVASRSDEVFMEYCKSLSLRKPAGPYTLALVAKLSKISIVIWEQLVVDSRMLHVKASSDIKGERPIHLLLLPTEEGGVYEFALLFPSDELVGPDDELKQEANKLDEESPPEPVVDPAPSAVVVEANPAADQPEGGLEGKQPPRPPPRLR